MLRFLTRTGHPFACESFLGKLAHTPRGGSSTPDLAERLPTHWREAMIAVLPEAQRQNMGVLLGSPMQQGWLSRRYDQEIDHGAIFLSPPRRAQIKALYELCDDCAIEIPVFCLRWALGVPGVSSVLTGPRSLAQLEQNVQAVEQGPLPEDIKKRLDEIAAWVPFRPCDEPFESPFRKSGYWGPGPA